MSIIQNASLWFKEELSMTVVERIVVCVFAAVACFIALTTIIIAQAEARIFLSVLGVSCVVLFFSAMGLLQLVFYPEKFIKQ